MSFMALTIYCRCGVSRKESISATDRRNEANFVVGFQESFGFRVFFVDGHYYLNVGRRQPGVKNSDGRNQVGYGGPVGYGNLAYAAPGPFPVKSEESYRKFHEPLLS
jgi:hypothetical protein